MIRLLVIDDEWLIRKGIVQMMKRIDSSWTIEEASNGNEAIEILKQAPFELVFCDIKMPGMDGIEMLETLNKLGIRIPVVFLTGYGEFNLMRNAIQLRAYDYLLKPINDNEITTVLSRFKKDFMNIKKLTEKQQTIYQKFKFKLLNALNSFQDDQVYSVIEEGQQLFNDNMTKKEYMDEIIIIASLFFSKHGITSFEREVVTSSNDLSNLANLSHAIQTHVSYLKKALSHNDKVITKAKEYINEHLHESLLLTEVANHVHFNSTYFSEYFKEKCGETFSQYVIRMKIEKAKEMLENPVFKIIEISDYLGYKDPRSFTKMFKLVMGMTPKEYRNNQQ